MFGLYNVHKPSGPTSHDVVAAVRRKLPRRTKLGHTGTLDPFAEGVLVLCAGPATRLADYVRIAPKRYLAALTLGATSATGDPEGEITSTPEAPPPSESDLRHALEGFVGEIQQVPPAHSAVKVGGRRAYTLARAGADLELPARSVRVYDIELVRYAWPRAELDVSCGSGTYVRALARDIGAALGVGGYCARLTRTAVGAFTLDEAVRPDELDAEADLLPALRSVEHLPRVVAEASEIERIALGQRVEVGVERLRAAGLNDPGSAPAEVAVVDDAGGLLAVATVARDGETLRPSKVFCAR